MRLKPPVKLLLAVVLLIGVVVSTWLVASHCKARERRLAGVPESRARLVEMLGSSRPFEGRLVGMSYASFDPARARKPLPRSRLKKALALANENRGDSAAERLANQAFVYGLGDELDLAIQSLTRATASKGGEPWMWSELSAFYVERFRRNGDSQDLLKALDSSAHAQDSPSLPLAARFNYALSLEKLSLFNLAKAAWNDYAARDRGSAWSAEAKTHLQNIGKTDIAIRWARAKKHLDEAKDVEQGPVARALVREFPQFSREYGEEELLGRWGTNWRKGNLVEAGHALSLARHLGYWLGAEVGEHMLEDSVAVIDRAGITNPRELASLARSHVLYQEALTAYKSGHLDTSIALFRSAAVGLRANSSPFCRWARLHIAACLVRSFQQQAAMRFLESIREMPDGGRYPALAGSTAWALGLIYGIQRDPAASLFGYRQGLEQFSNVREAENQANLYSMIAECLRLLGNYPLAWQNSWRSLQLLPQARDARKKYNTLSESASYAADLDLREAALSLVDEALQVFGGAGVVEKVVALHWKAIVCIKAKRLSRAEESVAAAKELLPEIADLNTRSTLHAQLLAVEGEALADESPDLAWKVLSKAVDISGRSSYKRQLGMLLLQRAKVEARLRRLDLAYADLTSAIEAVEEEYKKIPEGERGAFLAESRQVYDEMAKVELALGRKGEALAYVERARSRALLSSAPPSQKPPDPALLLASIQKSIPRGAVLIELQQLGDEYQAWLVRRERIDTLALGSTKDSIDQVIEAIMSSVARRNAAEFRASSAIAFDRVLRPLAEKLRPASQLIIVPDGSLYNLPFPALLDRSTGRFLIEDFPIMVTPSSASYAKLAARRGAGGAARPQSVLALGGPVVERRIWQSLPELPAAASEAREVAGVYPDSTLLLGADATKARFLGQAPSYQIIHVATHGIYYMDDPSLSLLILSPDRAGDSGALYADEIRRMSLLSAELVVLDVCGPSDVRPGRLGTANLAIAFLEAGVPAVVDALWQVRDGEPQLQELARHLHVRVRNGERPVTALRNTQLEAIRRDGRSASSVLSWAAFEAFGS